MDENYWKARCESAEAALAKARTVIAMTGQRRKMLAALAELRPSESIDTYAAAELLQVKKKGAFTLLSTLESLGLVERMPGRRGANGMPARWRLGYMVQVEASE